MVYGLETVAVAKKQMKEMEVAEMKMLRFAMRVTRKDKSSKMNVLHHLAMQSEALVVLLQETHCTDAEKLVLPNYQLAGSSLSRKHGLATFVDERLRYMLLDQSPPKSEIEWLCVDVDGYKIINIYKPPPTRL